MIARSPSSSIGNRMSIERPRLVPDIRLRVLKPTSHDYPLQLTDETAGWGCPFWGGQMIAAYMLGNPHQFSGLTIVDVGCGSGIAAIAAAKVGATAIALDRDPMALHAAQENAALNAVVLDYVWGNHRCLPDADLYLFGDQFYGPNRDEVIQAALSRPSLIGTGVQALGNTGQLFCRLDERRISEGRSFQLLCSKLVDWLQA